MKLSQLYHLLTGQYLKQGDINHAEQEINQLTSLHCRNLLVVIDDVWHVEDAEPIVKAFNSCKIVLTTRMNDVNQYIPTKQVVNVGPMEPSEARSLLTYKVIDISQLSQEDVNLLDKLAQDVHLWPLLLSLVRGQFSHNLKYHNSSRQEAIHYVQTKLHDKGLTAFDKNNIENGRKYAVKICIEMTLELLAKVQSTSSDKIKSLILWTGIGTSLQTEVLHCLWNVDEHEARDAVDMLWAYGLVQFTLITIPPNNNTQQCVEVHAVISQFILENMNWKEAYYISAHTGSKSLQAQILGLFDKKYEVKDLASLSPSEYLQYRLCLIEHHLLPVYLKQINSRLLKDSYKIIWSLKPFQGAPSSQFIAFYPSSVEQINTLINKCQKIINNAHIMSRTLHQKLQSYLAQKQYSNLIQTVECYINEYPVGLVAQQAVSIVKKIMPYFDGEVLERIASYCDSLQMITPDYHYITNNTIPTIKLCIKELQQINSSLDSGSPSINVTYQYYLFGKHDEAIDLIETNYLIKLQESVPTYVATQADLYNL